ncbi:UNVERIFIED_CONTAM: hypothetical protein Slati_4180200 [Sesamum latifolium]|uniref:Uncharacterized protein n=1 Tax=Sesamum latifolium TaxID=2727402 RepID=A0AAW2T9Q6_9LAMI
MPRDHSFPDGYYNTKKLIKDLGLPMEKIDAYKNGCMLYWKDDIDLDYCKFCGEARYKPTVERNLNRKKTPYAMLRYLPITSPSAEVVCFTNDCRAHDVTCQPPDGGGIHVPPV